MTQDNNRTSVWLTGWLVWLVVIAAVNHLPTDWLPIATANGTDKALHIGAYFVFGILGTGALGRLWRAWPRPLVSSSALVVGALVAAADEGLQAYVPSRVPLMEDWLTDLLGLALAVIVARMASGRLARIWLGRTD